MFSFTEKKLGYHLDVIFNALIHFAKWIISSSAMNGVEILSMSHILEYAELLELILSNQLSKSISLYKPFTSLSGYAKNIIDVYFKNQSHIYLDYLHIISLNFPFVFDIFFDMKSKLINMLKIQTLFPNIQFLGINNIYLCSRMLQNILEYLAINNNESHLIQIRLEANDESDLSISDAVVKYKQQFNEIQFECYISNDTLIIYQKCKCCDRIMCLHWI
eukprot:517211_1